MEKVSCTMTIMVPGKLVKGLWTIMLIVIDSILFNNKSFCKVCKTSIMKSWDKDEPRKYCSVIILEPKSCRSFVGSLLAYHKIAFGWTPSSDISNITKYERLPQIGLLGTVFEIIMKSFLKTNLSESSLNYSFRRSMGGVKSQVAIMTKRVVMITLLVCMLYWSLESL